MQKSAFIAVIGRPSAGKSTLVNQLCGYKVSIVSPVPQTTRNAIRGIHSSDRGQLVFVDTPGFHDSEKKLNLKLKDLVRNAIDDCDAVLYVVDTSRPFGDEEKSILQLLAHVQVPVLLGLNKVDLLAGRKASTRKAATPALPDPEQVHEVLQAASNIIPQAKILRFSALDGTGIEALKDSLYALAPEGNAWYPEDFYTDQDPEFRIAEVIREQVMNRTREEIPHASFIEIEDLELRDSDGNPVPKPSMGEWKGIDDETSPPPPLADNGDEEEDEALAESEEGPGGHAVPADMLAASGVELPADWSPQDLWELDPARRPKLWIRAVICVERDSQKGILIGKGGSLIKMMRLESIKELRELFPYRIELDLRVKVSAKWRQSEKIIGRIIH